MEQQKILDYQNYMAYAIAFFIPVFPVLNNLFIACFLILGLISLAKGYAQFRLTSVSVIMLSLYALHLVGLLYTSNMERGLFDIEVKLSLMIFPIAFLGYTGTTQENYRAILRMFLIGTFTAAAFCLLQSSYKVLILDYGYWHFLTSRFSVIVHQSYFAMYLIFALLIHAYLEWPLMRKNQRLRTFGNIGIFLFLSIAVVLTGSKIGFIMWFFIMLGLMIALVKTLRLKWLPIILMVIISSIIGVIFQNAPMLQERVVNMVKVAKSDEVDHDSKESTAVRSLVYSSAWEIVSTQDWFGQGTGDFQDRLDEVYNERQYTMAAEQHLNAHNLFFQTWIALGIPGLTMVIGLFSLMFYQSIKHREYIYLGFTLLFLLISLTESALNMRAGVIFFAFFTTLFAKKTSNAPNAH
jgi:O-antigen ligase